MSDIDLAISTFVGDAMISTGMNPKIIRARGHNARATSGKFSGRNPSWSSEEFDFLRQNIGYLSMRQLSEKLGRSENAIKIQITRRGIGGPSKQGWLSGHQAAKMIGVDGHAVVGWIDRGIMPGRILPMERKVRVIEFDDLKKWLLVPENWPRFKVERITNPYLRRLVTKAQQRWGDEWLTTAQVAEMKGSTSKLVCMAIKRGKLDGIQLKFISGRDRGTWGSWFVRKSIAQEWRSPKCTDPKKPISESLKRFIVQEKAKGKTYLEIGRMVGMTGQAVMYQFNKIKKAEK